MGYMVTFTETQIRKGLDLWIRSTRIAGINGGRSFVVAEYRTKGSRDYWTKYASGTVKKCHKAQADLLSQFKKACKEHTQGKHHNGRTHNV